MNKIYALHGFLGKREDWEILAGHFEYEAIDLFDLQYDKDLLTAAGGLNKLVEKQNMLMGYSLGGRLALHALVDSPTIWSRGVIISAQPGLSQAEARNARVEVDKRWAERFKKDPWDKLMDDWNKQPVFTNVTPRDEKDYSRERLAEMMLKWSLGRQQDLKAQIEALNMPLLWIVGKRDEKYVKIALSMKFSHPKSRLWIAPGAGHRVPWETTELFLEQVKAFVEEP